MTTRQDLGHMLVIFLLGTGLGLLASPGADAQNFPPASEPPKSAITGPVPGNPLSDSQRASTDFNRDASELPSHSAANTLRGLLVFGSDGQRVGKVADVKTGSDGAVAEIHIRTEGFLGFWTRIVSIPAGKFAKSGQNV